MPDIGTTDFPGLITERLEEDFDRVVPDIGHISEGLVLNRDGSVMAVVRMPSHTFQLDEMGARNVRRSQYDQLWKNIADSNVTVATHLVHRRRVDPPAVGRFRTKWAADLFGTRRRNCLSALTFDNTWFLTVLVSPRFTPMQTINRLLRRKSASENSSLVGQAEAILGAVMPYVGAEGGRRLGYRYDEHGDQYSEIAEARRMCLYGRFQPVPVVDGPLGAAIYNERIVCGSRAIRIEGFDGPRYARPLAFNRYPAKTRTGQLAHLLDLKCDFVLAQSFRFASRSASETSIYLRQTHMSNALGVQEKAIAALSDAHEDVQSGADLRGDHNLSLIVFGSDIETVNAAAGLGANAINKAGASPIHDDDNSFAAFWAGFPGNAEWMQARSADIRTDNFTALSEFNGYPAGGEQGPWGRSLIQFRTSADTIYEWQPHVGLVGHTLFLGKTRSGKTALLNLLLCSLEQVGARIFYFDRDRCAEPMIRASGGIYLALRSGAASGMAPLRGLSGKAEDRAFLVQWISGLIRLDGRGDLKSGTPKRIARGVDRTMKLPPAKRTLAGLRAFIGFEEGGDGERLDVWCRDGALGWMFDGEADEIQVDADFVGVDMTALLTHHACPAVAAYLLHRIRPRIDGTPFVVACPEARYYLLSTLFAAIIEDFALGLAKKNAALWLDTQEPQHLLNSDVGASLVSQCATIFQYPTRTADRDTYLNRLGFSPAMFKAITEEMPVMPFRSVLMRRENEAVILNVELTDMPDEIAVLSGTEATVRLIPAVVEETGDDPDAFRDEFTRRVREQEQAAKKRSKLHA